MRSCNIAQSVGSASTNLNSITNAILATLTNGTAPALDIAGGLLLIQTDGVLVSQKGASFANGLIGLQEDGGATFGNPNGAFTINASGGMAIGTTNCTIDLDGTITVAGKIVLQPEGSAQFANSGLTIGTDGGLNIASGFNILNADGSASFANGATTIDTDGRIDVGGGSATIHADGSAIFGGTLTPSGGVVTVEGDTFYAHTVAGNLVWTTSP